MSRASNHSGHPYSVWLVAAGPWEVGAQAWRAAGNGNPIIRRLLSGNSFFIINRLVRFLPLELSRCLVTSRSLERLVTPFGVASSFGHHPSLTMRLCISR